MKNFFVALAGMVCLSVVGQATTVQYTLSPTVNVNEFRVLFTTDVALSANQAIVVQFPYSAIPPSFVSLANPMVNGVVPASQSAYSVYVHQPNSAPGAAGDITLIRISGTGGFTNFSIDATYSNNSFPLTLPYSIQQFDGSGSGAVLLSTVSSGTANLASSGVPEPSSVLLSLSGTLTAGCWAFYRRKTVRT